MSWQSYLEKLIYPKKVEAIHEERGEEIKDILENISKYEYDPINLWKNIRKNEDLARSDFNGALQGYILGAFDLSILHSCFAVEIGLITALDKKLTDDEKLRINKPTLNILIKKAVEKNILNDNIKKQIYKIMDIRNIHIHRVNFISGLMISYKSYYKIIADMNINSIEFAEKYNEFIRLLPENLSTLISEKYNIEEIRKAIVNIQNMSTLEWAANKDYLNEIKKEVNKIIEDMATDFINKNFANFNRYFQDVILKNKANKTLNLANNILKEIMII